MIGMPTAALRRAARAAALATLLFALRASAQNIRTLDISAAPGDTTLACYTDSALAGALAAFNAPTTVRIFGGIASYTANQVVEGNFGVYQGSLRMDGTVRGRIVVFNGDVHLTRTAVVTGDVDVFGGHLSVDPGAHVGGPRHACEQLVRLDRAADGQLGAHPVQRSFRAIASEIAFHVGDVRIAPHLGISQYNRVEGLPINVGVQGDWRITSQDSLLTEVHAIVRTARDPAASRAAVGWFVSGVYSHRGALPWSFGVSGGSTVNPTADVAASPLESGLSAFVLRRDYSDWLLNRGVRFSAAIHPLPEIHGEASLAEARQSTVLAVNAVSLFRSTESWRPNPLIDDGKYRTVSARVTWDARDELKHPVLAWYGFLELRRVSSNHLTPVSLPTTIRDGLPSSRYGETEGDLDVRGYLRINPEQRLDLRLTAGGYLSGDPLTIQRRRAIGGLDPLPGYDFRAVNCDSRRKPDSSIPALCDRMMAVQVQYRYQLPVDLRTRIAGYSIGIRKPDLVLLADAGSAWLAGDSAGRVPANRIESISEWRSDFGVGITTGWFGLYVVKSIVDPVPVGLRLFFSARF